MEVGRLNAHCSVKAASVRSGVNQVGEGEVGSGGSSQTGKGEMRIEGVVLPVEGIGGGKNQYCAHGFTKLGARGTQKERRGIGKEENRRAPVQGRREHVCPQPVKAGGATREEVCRPG